MGTWSHWIGGALAVETFPDDLDAYYAAQPGYSRVPTTDDQVAVRIAELKAELGPLEERQAAEVTGPTDTRSQLEAVVGELKGPALDAAAGQVGVDPKLKVGEKRDAIVDELAGDPFAGIVNQTTDNPTGIVITQGEQTSTTTEEF